jgi:phenylalanyl-tRNA synthetase alpha chain
MLAKGSWRETTFKAYNFSAGAGAPPQGGHLHPLLKARALSRSLSLARKPSRASGPHARAHL